MLKPFQAMLPTLRSLLTSNGGLPYGVAGSAPLQLAPGSALNFLRMNAGATAPEWAVGGLHKIAEISGDGASGVLEFASIPATYRNLLVSFTGRSSVAATAALVQMTFETTPTAGAYNYQYFRGNGATASAAESIGPAVDYIFAGAVPGASATANAAAVGDIVLAEYAATSLFKATLARIFSTTGIASGGLFMDIVGGLYESAAAINRIRLILSAGNWTTTSRATLWGVGA